MKLRLAHKFALFFLGLASPALGWYQPIDYVDKVWPIYDIKSWRGRVWFATYDGVASFDPTTGMISIVSKATGLATPRTTMSRLEAEPDGRVLLCYLVQGVDCAGDYLEGLAGWRFVERLPRVRRHSGDRSLRWLGAAVGPSGTPAGIIVGDGATTYWVGLSEGDMSQLLEPKPVVKADWARELRGAPTQLIEAAKSAEGFLIERASWVVFAGGFWGQDDSHLAYGSGIWRRDVAMGKWACLKLTGDGVVRAMMREGDVFWVGTEGGVVRLDEKTRQYQVFGLREASIPTPAGCVVYSGEPRESQLSSPRVGGYPVAHFFPVLTVKRSGLTMRVLGRRSVSLGAFGRLYDEDGFWYKVALDSPFVGEVFGRVDRSYDRGGIRYQDPGAVVSRDGKTYYTDVYPDTTEGWDGTVRGYVNGRADLLHADSLFGGMTREGFEIKSSSGNWHTIRIPEGWVSEREISLVAKVVRQGNY